MQQNINKIDFDLKEIFESVKISDKSVRNNYYYEIVVETITEINDEKKQIQLIIDIPKSELHFNNIKWSYYANPLDESSKVERESNVNELVTDVIDIIMKNKMDKDYINSLSPITESINESFTSNYDKIENILSKFNISEKLYDHTIEADEHETQTRTLIYTKQNILESERINLQKSLQEAGCKKIVFNTFIYGDQVKIVI